MVSFTCVFLYLLFAPNFSSGARTSAQLLSFLFSNLCFHFPFLTSSASVCLSICVSNFFSFLGRSQTKKNNFFIAEYAPNIAAFRHFELTAFLSFSLINSSLFLFREECAGAKQRLLGFDLFRGLVRFELLLGLQVGKSIDAMGRWFCSSLWVNYVTRGSLGRKAQW